MTTACEGINVICFVTSFLIPLVEQILTFSPSLVTAFVGAHISQAGLEPDALYRT